MFLQACLLLVFCLCTVYCDAARIFPNPVARSTPSTTSFVNGPCSQTAYPVPNAGFETGDFAPWQGYAAPMPDTSATIVSPGYQSKYAVQLFSNTSAGYPQFYIDNTVNLCAANKYQLSFEYKMLSTSQTCSVIIYQTVTGSQPSIIKATDKIPVVATDWATHVFAFSEYTHDQIGLVIDLSCEKSNSTIDATVLFDNFRLDAVGSLEPAGCPTNVSLTNGGFDSGNLAPWTVLSKDTITNASVGSPGYNSPYLYQIEAGQGFQSKLQLGQFVDGFCLDYTYAVSFDFRFDGGNPKESGCGIIVDLETCDNSRLFYFGAAGDNAGWQGANFTCVMEDSSSQKLLRVNLRCDYMSRPSTFNVSLDNFQVGLA